MGVRSKLLAGVALVLAPALVQAQTSPNWPLRYVPTPLEWNGILAAKADYSRLVLEINRALAAEAGLLASRAPASYATPRANTARDQASRSAERLSVRDWGAACDGTTDDSQALANAATALRGSGTKIQIPGNCRLRLGGTAQVVLQGVGLEGDGVMGFDAPYGTQGSQILITDTARSPILVGSSWSVRGLTFYWPNQQSAATPIAYPPMLAPLSSVSNVIGWSFENNQVVNAYALMNFAAAGGFGHGRIGRNSIFCLQRCITMGRTGGEIFITDNQFTPAPFQAVALPLPMLLFEFATLAAEAIRLEGDGTGSVNSTVSTDGLTITSNYFFGLRYGIRVQGGTMNLGSMVNNGFDYVLTALSADTGGAIQGSVFASNRVTTGRYAHREASAPAVQLVGGAGNSQLVLAGNDFSATAGQAVVVNDTGSSSISITGGRMWNIGGNTDLMPAAVAVDYTGPNGQFNISGVNLRYTRTDTPAVSAIHVAASQGAAITGNQFYGWGAAVVADANAVGMTYSGNSFMQPGVGATVTLGGVNGPGITAQGNFSILDNGQASFMGADLFLHTGRGNQQSQIHMTGALANLGLFNDNGQLFQVSAYNASPQTSWPFLVSGTATSAPQYTVDGPGPNADVFFRAKGTGVVRIQVQNCATAQTGEFCSNGGSGSAVVVK